jgi:hypothetical protein
MPSRILAESDELADAPRPDPTYLASTQRLVHIVPISDIMSSEPKVELSLHDLVYPSLTLGSVGDPMCSYFFANCPLKVA